jgi:DNA-binding NarL/FixJ family response regulator
LITVAVVAPNLPLRLGLREMISNAGGIEITGEAAILEDALGLGEAADILLLASAAPDALRELSELPSAPGLLVMSDDPRDAQALAGTSHAWGILPLDASEDELVAAITALSEGLVVGAPSLLREAWRKPAVLPLSVPPGADQLTVRETEVLGLMARGLANKQIAAGLRISEHTVKFHLSSVYAKLGANSRTEAVSIGTRLGLIEL